MSCLVEDDLYQTTAELFTDILLSYSKFLNQDELQMLFSLLSSQWAQGKFIRLSQGDFEFDSLQFGNLLIGFGDAIVPDLARKTYDTPSQQFLTCLNDLLACKGYAVEEDKIFVPALEFWYVSCTPKLFPRPYLFTNTFGKRTTFVEFVVDSLYSDGDDKSWIPVARTYIVQAIQKCWRKIQFPPPEVWNDWDSVDQTNFHDARRDVADLLQSSYTLTGSELLSMFANLVLQSLESGRWAELEASLFCLGTLSDCISDEENDRKSTLT